jgi:hypothetical protein
MEPDMEQSQQIALGVQRLIGRMVDFSREESFYLLAKENLAKRLEQEPGSVFSEAARGFLSDSDDLEVSESLKVLIREAASKRSLCPNCFCGKLKQGAEEGSYHNNSRCPNCLLEASAHFD